MVWISNGLFQYIAYWEDHSKTLLTKEYPIKYYLQWFLPKNPHGGFGNFFHWYLNNHRYNVFRVWKQVMKSTTKKLWIIRIPNLFGIGALTACPFQLNMLVLWPNRCHLMLHTLLVIWPKNLMTSFWSPLSKVSMTKFDRFLYEWFNFWTISSKFWSYTWNNQVTNSTCRTALASPALLNSIKYALQLCGRAYPVLICRCATPLHLRTIYKRVLGHCSQHPLRGSS